MGASGGWRVGELGASWEEVAQVRKFELNEGMHLILRRRQLAQGAAAPSSHLTRRWRQVRHPVTVLVQDERLRIAAELRSGGISAQEFATRTMPDIVGRDGTHEA